MLISRFESRDQDSFVRSEIGFNILLLTPIQSRTLPHVTLQYLYLAPARGRSVLPRDLMRPGLVRLALGGGEGRY